MNQKSFAHSGEVGVQRLPPGVSFAGDSVFHGCEAEEAPPGATSRES